SHAVISGNWLSVHSQQLPLLESEILRKEPDKQAATAKGRANSCYQMTSLLISCANRKAHAGVLRAAQQGIEAIAELAQLNEYHPGHPRGCPVHGHEQRQSAAETPRYPYYSSTIRTSRKS